MNMKQTLQPLTRKEHLRFACEIYLWRGMLRNLCARYKKSHYAVKQARRALRELEHLSGVLDDLYCAQFPDNPRPADPDFYDSPYISGAILRTCARDEQ
jgi:hypothetical protein